LFCGKAVELLPAVVSKPDGSVCWSCAFTQLTTTMVARIVINNLIMYLLSANRFPGSADGRESIPSIARF